jgi:ATP-dependent helicase/nuclease subunit A
MNHATPVARAQSEQLLASNPGVSAFVSAHAGAGKTKLLIDRLLRLMLSGADPARILCLTFTKAAAAEMAIRLQKALGKFVTLPDAALDDALKALLVTPSPEARHLARKLFATVLDLPAGMRISTIHAFCQSLLRRFPLEAGVSPHFRLVEERDARVALEAAREAALPQAPPALVAALAGLADAAQFGRLVGTLEKSRGKLGPILALPAAEMRAAFRRAAGVSAPDRASLIAAAVQWPQEAVLRGALNRAHGRASPAVARKAGEMVGWLNLPAGHRREHWAEWTAQLFNQDGKATALSKFCNDKLDEIDPAIREACAAEQARVGLVLDQMRALEAAEASMALLCLAAPVLDSYAGVKDRHGQLDYDDLIARSFSLLKDGGAAWVKYKLDAGIDHVLLDEVQDTAPAQWDIAGELTGDFFTGEGAARTSRSVFAVGDTKQSIYSFQGAEPDEFNRWRDRYAAQVKQAGQGWHNAVLDVSFRSTVPVLAVVDAVFAESGAAAGVCTPGALHHISNRVGQAGSVTLWPLAPRPDTPAPAAWTVPERNHAARSAAEDLVRALADWIAQATAGGMSLESEGRPLRPGDVLVLVRRRGQFARALVRELKARDVPVAGLDRMVLTDQPAVQDLMALAEALLLPQDDLSLAEMLVSPLGGLTDDSLMRLAAGRSGGLWDTLRARAAEAADWQAAHDMFSTLLNRVDFVSPHALFCEALGPLGGRARLFARLGPEAAEPVDELLAAALDHARDNPPSLQGFLHWLRQSGAEVKREAEAAGDVVRVMTVHGAKGLEAPLVVLPDTATLPPDQERLHWTRDEATGTALFLWAPNKDLVCDAVRGLRDAEARKREAEHNRLLYVALTRARDHLLVCGWQPHTEVSPRAWYTQIEAGLREAGAIAAPHPWGVTLTLSAPQTVAAAKRAETARAQAAGLPAWAGAAPDWRPEALPVEPPVPRPLAPSRPDGATLGGVPAARSPLRRPPKSAARARGVLVHALLQHLPDLPPDEWQVAADAFCGAEAPDVPDQVLGVLRAPGLAPLFGRGSRAEQRLAGLVGGHVLSGQVDRLAILPDRVLVADYKTSRVPPDRPEAVPVLYLRQMAAYRALLAQLYPGRAIECLLIWTDTAQVMVLPPALLDSHAPGLLT